MFWRYFCVLAKIVTKYIKHYIYKIQNYQPMKKNTHRRKKSRPLSIGQLVLFFVILAVLSALIAFFIIRPDKKTEQTHSTPVHQQAETAVISEKTTARNPLNGTWVSDNDGSILEIHQHTFSIEIPSIDRHTIRKGNCEVIQNQIRFSYSDSLSNCLGKPGIYTFLIIKKTHVQFTPVKDACSGRAERLSAKWERF
jgi:hypothetical protein